MISWFWVQFVIEIVSMEFNIWESRIMKKRLLKLLEAALVILVVIGCVNLKAEASTSGTGTESDPYGLPNKSEFAGGYRLILPLEDNL